MTQRRHPYFGVLKAEADGSFNWEPSRDGVQFALHIDRLAEMNDERLDSLAKLYQQFPTLDRAAREATRRDSDDPEGSAKLYEDFVRDSFPDADTRNVLGTLLPVRLWSWLGGDEEVWVTLDYVFAPGEMDHVLCARFNGAEEVVSLHFES